MEQSKPGNSRIWIGCLIFWVIGLLGLVVLAGGAYYFGFIVPRQSPVVMTTEPIATEEVATALATVPPVTELPEATSTVAVSAPEVEPYDVNLNVQYPSLAVLADGSGNVTILPGQPTILEIHWCAKGESPLSKMTNLLDLTVLINDIEVPASSFHLSQYQTTLQINSEKKDTALCNILTGLVRNWGNGEYTVKLSLRATAEYNDGWENHPADEVENFTYQVSVNPTSSLVEWDRCKAFEALQPELVFLDPQPKQPHELYFKFEDGVPGLETEVAGDVGDWEYHVTIGEAVSDKACIFQNGYDGRLYCKVDISSDYVRSVQPVSISVNGCNWPVYLTNAEIP